MASVKCTSPKERKSVDGTAPTLGSLTYVLSLTRCYPISPSGLFSCRTRKQRYNLLRLATAYYIRTEGMCEEIIESKDECATAVTELELTATNDFQDRQSDKPTGCIYNPKKPNTYTKTIAR